MPGPPCCSCCSQWQSREPWVVAAAYRRLPSLCRRSARASVVGVGRWRAARERRAHEKEIVGAPRRRSESTKDQVAGAPRERQLLASVGARDGDCWRLARASVVGVGVGARRANGARAREILCWCPARASVVGVGCWCAATASSFLRSLRPRAEASTHLPSASAHLVFSSPVSQVTRLSANVPSTIFMTGPPSSLAFPGALNFWYVEYGRRSNGLFVALLAPGALYKTALRVVPGESPWTR